jgi:hypothetical protein
MGTEGDACPVDGSALLQREDVMRDALVRAIRTDARIMVLRHHDQALGPLGGIAATLRF